VILGFASVAVANKLSTTNAIVYLSIFALSVAAALTWAYQFYRPHNLYAASIALAVVALLTLPMLYFIYQASVPLFFATTVYQVWVITATYLSYNYAKLN
jgi:tryptophan-rich sensory protein